MVYFQLSLMEIKSGREREHIPSKTQMEHCKSFSYMIFLKVLVNVIKLRIYKIPRIMLRMFGIRFYYFQLLEVT